MQKSFSIIAPVYNPGPLLIPCLDSVLAQTVKEWELILVDDGCTDGSGAVCDEYAARDSRIRVIHTPNRGPGAARNTGLDVAEAPWICFLDADDTIDPDYLEILLSADPTPGALVMTGIIQHYDDGRPDETVYSFPETAAFRDFTQIDRKLKILIYASPNTKRFDAALIRREGLRFPTHFSIQEDLIFYLDYLMHADQIILLPGIPYHYFHRSGATSLVHKERTMEEFLAAGIAITEKMLQLREAFPSYNKDDFDRAISVLALDNFIRALKACRNKAAYREVRAEIQKRKPVFFKHFRHGHGIVHKWWLLILAAAGIGPLHKNDRFSHIGKI